MRRLLPRSLAAQMALLLGIALLVAQLVNFALILNERQKLSLAQNEGPAITRFANVAADLAQAAPEFRQAVVEDASHRGARFSLEPSPRLAAASRDAAIETRLASALISAEWKPATVRAGTERGGTRRADMQSLRLEARLADGHWLSARMLTPRRDPLLALRLGAATLLVYLIVLGATLLIAIRIARPLRDLTSAAERFGGREEAVFVRPRGPDDLRSAIEAFNAMNGRVMTLLDEKDRMLGAIGHDLRTPLASLRIRVENMEPDEERAAAVAKIEEMTTMLEDILVLARSGRNREESRPVDVTALVDAVAEEYRALRATVTFEGDTRHVLAVQPNLLRRAIRNLIDNALKYTGEAEVMVRDAADGVEIHVIDRGPGIAAGELERVLQPFYRIEQSRSRDTGGAGLGLAIARSIAEGHGGTLRLEPTQPHGLTAIIALPKKMQEN